MQIPCACDCDPAVLAQLPPAFQEVVVETPHRLFLAYVDLQGVWRDLENRRPIFGVSCWYEAQEQDSSFLKRLVIPAV